MFFCGILIVLSLYGCSSANPVTSMSSDKKNEVTSAHDIATQPSSITGSRYVDYSIGAFNSASGKKRVLFFHANWCPECIKADKEFTANLDKIPTDTILFKTDYDTSTDLKKKYGVTYQHTYVFVDKVGNEITKWNGGGLDDLIRAVK